MNDSKINETKSNENPLQYRSDEGYVDENLRQMQNIEGGGPPKKIILNTLPRPLRILWYFFMAIMIGMGMFAVGITLFR
ncbi:hypothetical protein SAMN02799624_03567 [Paenibacillus sp. UNC496MF]|uniref:hypothetical protein n=1 Tax=Paenibacillus sp. UNC496MF TaxID=1502753 RepID=UPI0008F2B40E|nr:hypothetical protein [Paenibacillus sp. UNC496MF]SFJ16975.1 hypothetical protein SAMN02799624_03567 [Paenibacillus sp. UNC496MF]